MMRIISGNLKGRKIAEPKSKNTRPLKDLTKESIFNVLQHSNLIKFNFEKSSILDLFSGVGSFGLECISRGSKNVVFCENFKETIKILKENINKLECTGKSEIITENIFNIKNIEKLKERKFEIIFLDPPYKERKLKKLLEEIIQLNILKKNGIIILHRHKKENELYPKNFNILKIKYYGISQIIFGLIS
tara:strand:+ start:182 stop:751 length:570 start_codon:yes stop_codon:yes gene_type:complete